MSLPLKMLTNKNSKQETGTERTGECFSMPGGQCLTLPLETLTNNNSKQEKGTERTGKSDVQCPLTLPLKTLTSNNSSKQETGTERTGGYFSLPGGQCLPLPQETLSNNNSNKRSRRKGQKGQVSSSLSSGVQCQT